MAGIIEFETLLAPVENIGAMDPLHTWSWLVPPGCAPVLLTALGDMFVESPDGTVHFLDTYEGSLKFVSSSYDQFKVELQDSRKRHLWFLPDLVAALQERRLTLSPGQCYSPRVHTLLGGQMHPDNFEAVQWAVHFIPLGVLVDQILRLPPGTPIAGIDVQWK